MVSMMLPPGAVYHSFVPLGFRHGNGGYPLLGVYAFDGGALGGIYYDAVYRGPAVVPLLNPRKSIGAGHFRIYGQIVFPLMRNGLLTTTVLMFMKIWGQYLWPSLVTATNISPSA